MSDPRLATAKPTPSRRRGWVGGGLYWVGWAVAVSAATLLLLAAVFWWGQRNPSDLAKLGLEMFAPGSGVSIGEVDLDTPGALIVREVEFADGVRLGEVEVKYSGEGVAAWKKGEVKSVTLRGGHLRINDALMAKVQGGGGGNDAGSAKGRDDAEESGAGSEPWWSRGVPERVLIEGVRLEVDLAGAPEVAGTVSLELAEIRPLVAGSGGVKAGSVVLKDAVWKGEGAPDPVSFGELKAALDVSPDFRKVHVTEASVSGLKADLTREGLAIFLDAPVTDEAGGEPLPEIVIDRLVAKKAELSFSGLEQLAGLRGAKVGVDFELGGLVIADGALRSADEQSLRLGAAEIFAPGADVSQDAKPLVSWDLAELRAVPDDLLERGEVAAVRLEGFEANVSQASLGKLLDEIESGAGEDGEVGASGTSERERPPLIIRDLHVAGAALHFDPDGFVAGIPAGSAKLEMRSESGLDTADGDVQYAVELTAIEAKVDAADEKPFATGAKVVAEFSALGLQRDGVIESVSLSGVRAEVGEAVQKLAAEAAGSTPADAGSTMAIEKPSEVEDVAADDAGPELSIARLEIEDTAITLRDIVPGALPVLTIGIDTSLEDIPLLGRSRGDEVEQRIEVKGVRIASQYNPLQNVAELETMWVYFTIPGLFRQEIRRVEVVSPSVYVGEPLFWFVDYMRKYAEGEAEVGEGDEAVVETVAAAEENEIAEPDAEENEIAEPDAEGDAIVAGLKGFELGGWKFGQLKAHAGRIIVAPTGTPLGIVPFPFEAATDFDKGEISVEVEVPSGDYVFEQLELELRDLSGKAFVNYPVAGVNNNFVQTFESPLVKFQKFEAQEVWLSVTYDEKGIYGTLGGKAYGGYVEGGFNIYIEGPYKWDAWVAGTEFDLGAFTDVLAPETLRMRGVVDGKFITEGQEFDVDWATGELATRGEGTMHVIKLDDLREALPEDWEPLWKAISNAGIDAFRDYHFATGKADVVYEAGEGEANIEFDGDEGGRNLQLRLFDRRGAQDGEAKVQGDG